MSSSIDQIRVLSSPQFDNYTTIYLWLTVSFAQMIIILLLVFKTPFRNLLVARLDELKIGRAQLVVKSISAAVFAVMMYNIYSLSEIRYRSVDAVILAFHIFEVYLIGFSLIFLVTIDTLHQYIKELAMAQETIRAAKKHKRACEKCLRKSADETEIIRKDISRLKTEITNLESECSMKDKEVQLLNTDTSQLKSTLEGAFGKYDELLAYNKDLKEQLEGANERLSQSGGKKLVFFSWDRWGL